MNKWCYNIKVNKPARNDTDLSVYDLGSSAGDLSGETQDVRVQSRGRTNTKTIDVEMLKIFLIWLCLLY